MYKFNDKTLVDKQFKLNELFKLTKADKGTKFEANNSISSITLTRVLSQNTTFLEPSDYVKEIYIFQVELFSKQVPYQFIGLLDRQVRFQTLFIFVHKNEFLYYTSIKNFEGEVIKITKTFETNWIEELKKDFPITNKLEEVYKDIVSTISGYRIVKDESYLDYTNRYIEINKLKKEIQRLTKQMYAEKQPNTKMAINSQIKELKRELEQLEV